MNSQDLADAVEDTVERCVQRVLGVGKDQYDDGSGQQKFERMGLIELCDWTLEELDDVVVYAVMLGIQVNKLKSRLNHRNLGKLEALIRELDSDDDEESDADQAQ